MKTDALLKSDVTSELAWDTSVGERAGIGIAVRDGVVTVSGQVDNYMQKQAIERAVRRVSGVRGIAMDLEVKLAAGARPSDTDIAQAALNAMRWHSMVPEERVQIEVEDGHVTLSGELDWAYQVASAEQCVRPLLGVKDITNDIRIRPHVNTSDIAEGISSALMRHAQREARNISIQVDGGVVTLRGKVDSLREREAAVGTAWSAKGVTRVVDQLEVSA
ncbi:MAG: BON domain-containing protein [Hydrogenophaga sp.]|uniref:BON domain-containing protein n=1 Tax=Hydrogenophaga sp. TaxID=1904254 RepID=UPI00262E33DB|nr:BON domain-containing protein [Hydrogenophaga sp.]MCW5668291.1 BON domain-containing protein [Hydrogenophaga sp.]